MNLQGGHQLAFLKKVLKKSNLLQKRLVMVVVFRTLC